MIRFIKAENIKIRHTFFKFFIFMAPLMVAGLSFLVTFNYALVDNYNWWYTMFLPASIGLASGLLINMDKHHKNRTELAYPVKLEGLWYSKIFVMIEFTAISSFIIFFASIIVQNFTNRNFEYCIVDPFRGFVGIIVIIITFLWQIPVCMIISRKFNMYVSLIYNVVANLLIGFMCNLNNLFIINPYSYPSRLMIPIIKVLPNGLLAVPESFTFKEELLNADVIAPALIISIILFLIASYVTGKWYKNLEAV